MELYSSDFRGPARLFRDTMVALPVMAGVVFWSWLWFFGTLLGECVLLYLAFKYDQKLGITRRLERWAFKKT